EVGKIDAEGRAIRYLIDGSGNRTEVQEELGKKTHCIYATDGFLQESRDPDGRVVTFSRTFNPLDLNAYYMVTKTVVGYSTSPLNLTTTTTTDIMGNTRITTDAEGNATT